VVGPHFRQVHLAQVGLVAVKRVVGLSSGWHGGSSGHGHHIRFGQNPVHVEVFQLHDVVGLGVFHEGVLVQRIKHVTGGVWPRPFLRQFQFHLEHVFQRDALHGHFLRRLVGLHRQLGLVVEASVDALLVEQHLALGHHNAFRQKRLHVEGAQRFAHVVVDHVAIGVVDEFDHDFTRHHTTVVLEHGVRHRVPLSLNLKQSSQQRSKKE